MLKYIGFALILAGGIFFSREYEKRERTRVLECEEFLRFVKHIRMKIACFLSPRAEWLADFSSKLPSFNGFLDKARECDSLLDAFSKSQSFLSLGAEADILSSLFSSLGRGYKDDELSLLDNAFGELSSQTERIKGESEKSIRTVKTLAACVCVSLIILLV